VECPSHSSCNGGYPSLDAAFPAASPFFQSNSPLGPFTSNRFCLGGLICLGVFRVAIPPCSSTLQSVPPVDAFALDGECGPERPNSAGIRLPSPPFPSPVYNEWTLTYEVLPKSSILSLRDDRVCFVGVFAPGSHWRSDVRSFLCDDCLPLATTTAWFKL